MKTKQVLVSWLCLLGVALSACASAPAEPSIPRGKFDPPRSVPDFALTTQNDQPMKLSELRGKVVWLFFGYTHCPDVCPLTLGQMKAVKAGLGASASQVAFVFISVDGKRDTPDVVKKFVGSFDADFIGLTGDEAAVRRIAKSYSSEFDTPTLADTHDKPYQVSHTGYSYLPDQQGRWHFVYLAQSPVETIVTDIKGLLKT